MLRPYIGIYKLGTVIQKVVFNAYSVSSGLFARCIVTFVEYINVRSFKNVVRPSINIASGETVSTTNSPQEFSYISYLCLNTSGEPLEPLHWVINSFNTSLACNLLPFRLSLRVWLLFYWVRTGFAIIRQVKRVSNERGFAFKTLCAVSAWFYKMLFQNFDLYSARASLVGNPGCFCYGRAPAEQTIMNFADDCSV